MTLLQWYYKILWACNWRLRYTSLLLVGIGYPVGNFEFWFISQLVGKGGMTMMTLSVFASAPGIDKILLRTAGHQLPQKHAIVPGFHPSAMGSHGDLWLPSKTPRFLSDSPTFWRLHPHLGFPEQSLSNSSHFSRSKKTLCLSEVCKRSSFGKVFLIYFFWTRSRSTSPSSWHHPNDEVVRFSLLCLLIPRFFGGFYGFLFTNLSSQISRLIHGCPERS